MYFCQQADCPTFIFAHSSPDFKHAPWCHAVGVELYWAYSKHTSGANLCVKHLSINEFRKLLHGIYFRYLMRTFHTIASKTRKKTIVWKYKNSKIRVWRTLISRRIRPYENVAFKLSWVWTEKSQLQRWNNRWVFSILIIVSVLVVNNTEIIKWFMYFSVISCISTNTTRAKYEQHSQWTYILYIRYCTLDFPSRQV